jgi:predicted aspartyl protease
MKTPFSFALNPPIPALEIRLLNPVTGKQSAYQHAYIDTGSDSTVVSIDLLAQIQAAANREEIVYGLWGGQQSVPLYNIDILIDTYRLENVVVIGSEEPEILLGRNVTNQLRLLLDGPTETVELLD